MLKKFRINAQSRFSNTWYPFYVTTFVFLPDCTVNTKQPNTDLQRKVQNACRFSEAAFHRDDDVFWTSCNTCWAGPKRGWRSHPRDGRHCDEEGRLPPCRSHRSFPPSGNSSAWIFICLIFMTVSGKCRLSPVSRARLNIILDFPGHSDFDYKDTTVFSL